jgi:hypothetical protein
MCEVKPAAAVTNPAPQTLAAIVVTEAPTEPALTEVTTTAAAATAEETTAEPTK